MTETFAGGWLRKTVLLVFAASLLGAGAYLFYRLCLHPSAGVLRFGFGAIFLIAFGGFLIWDDFIMPHVRNQAPTDSMLE
jgi:hypothetical protein